MTTTLQTAGDAIEAAQVVVDRVALLAAENERLRQLLADACMALHNLSVYDTYNTEYDGTMMTLCQCCGTANGLHSEHCDFPAAEKVRTAIIKELTP